MNAETQKELWQVEVGGKIYDAVMAELPDWISEGSLLPGDKIRKGNLRWIEARKVPALVPFFNAKERNEPLPIVQTYTESGIESHVMPDLVQADAVIPGEVPSTAAAEVPQAFAPGQEQPDITGDRCSVHFDALAFYRCSSCGNVFCKSCPSSYGSNVKICPKCGAMCAPIEQIAAAKRQSSALAASVNEGFGMSDFFAALVYPFKFKSSLILGAGMFAFFTLGRSVSAVGGIFMVVAAIFCAMLANTLTFGILAHTVENFVKGRTNVDFMPTFDDFSLWDDVIHPFFLSIGAYAASFGPFLLVMTIGIYLVVSSANARMNKFKEEISRVPGTEYYAPDRTLEQTQQVKDLIERAKLQNDRRLERQTQIERGEVPTVEDRSDDIARSFEDGKNGQILTGPDQPPLEKEDQYAQVAGVVLRLAAPLVIIGLITFMWGIFYFPAACAVAGYSRSFVETVNPMVGIDTIRRLGINYGKVLLMGLCLIIASMMIVGFLEAIFSPLSLPRMGNLPAKVIGSLFGFYFSIVFSCILGFAMFKAGDRLKLPR